MEGSAGTARHAGHSRREGEACGDADHGRRWSGTGTGTGTAAGLIWFGGFAAGSERNEWSGVRRMTLPGWPFGRRDVGNGDVGLGGESILLG